MYTSPTINDDNVSNQTPNDLIVSILVYYQNVNGLLSKRNRVYAEILAANFEIYAFTETALNESIKSSEIFPQQFSVYRCDRSSKTSDKQCKGGTLIAVTNKFTSELISTGENEGCEHLWVKISSEKRNLIIGCVYIPPNSNSTKYIMNMNYAKESIIKTNSDSTVILLGDFNLPNLNWERTDEFSNTYIPMNTSSEAEEITIDSCHEMGLNQINYHRNDNGRLLDLLWTNDPDQCTCNICPNHLLENETHHKAITVELSFHVKNTIDQGSESYLDFIKADYDKINNDLMSVDWERIFGKNSTEKKIQNFYGIINDVISKHVQLKIRKPMIHPKWFDKRAVNLKNQMNNLHKKFKKNDCDQLRAEYNAKRSEYKNYIKQKHYDYKIAMQQILIDDPQQFFKHVSYSKKQSENIPRIMKLNGKTSNDPKETVDFFRQFFESVYKPHDDNIIAEFEAKSEHTDKLNNVCMNIPPISINEDLIGKKIDDLPSNLVAGPDNIPNIFIKNCLRSLIKPITHILKSSFSNAEIPTLWKSSYVRPIFKNGSKSDIKNYRGVAIQCIIPKLLDSIIAHHINEHIKNVITEHQHGFTVGKSTVTNLAEFTNSITAGIASHKQVDAVYLDISKAFDTVNVELLCYKLKLMGLNSQILQWITAYLNGRQQLVKIDSSTISNPINVSSGVGQGYPIGATLFTLFMYELPFYLTSSKLHLFADDGKISMPVNSSSQCENLQIDLNAAHRFFEANHLFLNTEKSRCITYFRGNNPIHYAYTINNRVIDRTSEIKDLGVILDSKLTFRNHIEYISTRAKSLSAWMRRFTREFDDPWVIKSIYSTFVLPVLEYASQIWAPHYMNHIAKLESIQKQFLLYALRKFNWPDRFHLPPYKHRLLLLQMNTLEERRIIQQIIFIQSLINNSISAPNLLNNLNFRVPARRTRLITPLSELQNIPNDPFSRMKIKYNEYFHLFDFNTTKNKLKNILKNYFKSNI